MLKNWSMPLPWLDFRGQAAYARREIRKGEMLEYSPVIPIPEGEWQQVSHTVLRFYRYAWGEDNTDAAIALGYGSLFRTSPGEPFACYVNDHEKMVTAFYAANDIEQGEEITVCRRQPGCPGDPGGFYRRADTAEPGHPGKPGNGIMPAGGYGLDREHQARLLSIQHSPGKGRGVYARSSIAQGQLIERAPALFIPAGEWYYIKNTVLNNYWFSFGPNREHVALALGYGSLYNHSYTPNALYEVREEEMTVRFKALREIQPGEEIFINYNRDPLDKSPLWFDVLPP